MSFLEKLKAGKRNVKMIKFPGTDKQVALQVLSSQELQDSVLATEKHFKGLEVEIGSLILDSYEDERATQMIFRALRDPEDHKKPLAADVRQLRDLLTKEEKGKLVEAYLEFERECSPDFRQMSDQEFEKLWDEVKKNPQTLSSDLPSGMLRRLLNFLASRPAMSPPANGSIS